MTQLNSLSIINDIDKTLDKDIETAITFVTKTILNNIEAKPSDTILSDQEKFWMDKFGTHKTTGPLPHQKLLKNTRIIRQAAEELFHAFG